MRKGPNYGFGGYYLKGLWRCGYKTIRGNVELAELNNLANPLASISPQLAELQWGNVVTMASGLVERPTALSRRKLSGN